MVRNTSAEGKSKRSNKTGEGDPGGPQASQLDEAPSFADRIQAEREQLFKALAIVECCKYASATLYEVSDPEYMVPVYKAVCDLLNRSAGELGRIADDCERSGRSPDNTAVMTTPSRSNKGPFKRVLKSKKSRRGT